jgi:hypothetical protein
MEKGEKNYTKGSFIPKNYFRRRSNQDMKKNGPLANIFGGYLYRYKNFAISGEAFYELGKVEDKIDRSWTQGGADTVDFQGYYTAILEKKNGFGFRANIGGVLYDKTFLYALLGVSGSQLRYSSVSSLLDVNSAANYQPSYNAKRKLSYGFDYGVGVQHQLGQWRIGIEAYIRNIKNQSFNFDLNPTNPTIQPQPQVYAKLKPNLVAIALKAIFVF